MESTLVNALASIAVAVITGLVTLIGIKSQNSKRDAVKEAKEEARWERLEEWQERVETKLDEHNGYSQKFAESAVALGRIDERLKNLEGSIK